MIAEKLFKLFMLFHIFIYRRTNGALGGRMRGMPVLLLTTTGRKSGLKRTVPLMYLSEGDHYIVTASNSGRAKDPVWWSNLKSNPQAQIQVSGIVKPIVASQCNSEDKKRYWARLIAQAPFFNAYQKATQRDIPMVILRPQ